MLEEFEKQLARQRRLTYHENLKIFKALYKEAVALKALNSNNIMDGVEKNIRLAKALNSLEKKWNS
ncbi:MAG: hypothetical protein JW804_08935 [Sedimentisphaerales bacterium]|nr:hypothetical protein [Sedimentisphaerales bacterium]